MTRYPSVLLTSVLAIAMLTACSSLAKPGGLPGDRNEVPTKDALVPEVPLPVLDKRLELEAPFGEASSTPETEQHEKVDLTGEWRLLVENGQSKRTLKLFLKQNGNRLDGRIDDPAEGEAHLHGGVIGNSVRFSTETEVRGLTLRSAYQGTRIGGRLAGTVVIGTTRPATPPDRKRVPNTPIPERSYAWSARRANQ